MPSTLALASFIFIFFLLLFFWLKWRRKVSKGHFALSVLSSLLTSLILGFSALSSNLPTEIISRLSVLLGFGELETNISGWIVVPMTVFTTYFIYKFGKSAVKNWDAPPRVSEIDLAEKHLENSLFALSAAQLRLILKRQVDHIASDAVSNWKEKLTETPKPVETKDLLRDMLVSSIRELRFPDNGWRDEGKMWIGKMLGISLDKTKTAIAFVFDTQPNETAIKERIDSLKIEKDDLQKYRFFGLYSSKNKKTKNDISELLIYNQKIEILSSRRMIINALDLRNYAIELITI
jgi:hypothetical protein